MGKYTTIVKEQVVKGVIPVRKAKVILAEWCAREVSLTQRVTLSVIPKRVLADWFVREAGLSGRGVKVRVTPIYDKVGSVVTKKIVAFRLETNTIRS